MQEIIGSAVTSSGIIISVLSNKSKTKNNASDNKVKEVKLTFKGALFAIIAGIAQGIGLVVGKVGMIHYHENIPLHLAKIDNAIPLATSFLRISVGLIGFIIIAAISKQFIQLKQAVHNKKGF